MEIYLLDINKEMTDAWQQEFKGIKDIIIDNDDFAHFMDRHCDIEAVVSPANSFGLMDGGYDKAITDYFGQELMQDVQKVILREYYGEQPVGTSITVEIRHNSVVDQKYFYVKPMILIHTPSMRTPEVIKDYRIIYRCMRATLIEAKKRCINTIVIPAFGGLTGRVPCDVIAKMMRLGYEQVFNKPEKLDWKYAMEIARKLNE